MIDRGGSVSWKLLSSLVLALALATAAQAARGRLVGKVVDDDGRPVEGVLVTITSIDQATYRETRTTDKKGGFTINFSRAESTYKYAFEKAGYQSFNIEIPGRATEVMREEFVMHPGEGDTGSSTGTALEAALVDSQNAAVKAFNAGLTAQRSRDLKTARARFEEALAIDDELQPAYAALARVCLDLEDFAAAVAAAEEVLAVNPRDVDALRISYDSYRALGDRDKASVASEALKQAEDGAASAKRMYNEGATAYQAKDYETALARFGEAATLDPSLMEAHQAMAAIYVIRGQFEEAAEAADKALNLVPDNENALRSAYAAHKALGHQERLREVIVALSVMDAEFGAQNLVKQGGELFNAGQTEEAKVMLDSALAIDPNLPKAHYMLGVYYIGKSENEKARGHLEKFIATGGDDPDVALAKEMLGYLD